MTAQPQWESVDNYTTDLLALVALGTPQGDADREWDLYVKALQIASQIDCGPILPNTLRPLVRGQIAPKRLGAFVSRAISQKLIAPDGGWQISDDTEGRNAGRPCRTYVWIGSAA